MNRRLNLKLVLCLLAVLAVLGTSVHFLHGYQVKRNATVLRKQAERALEEGRPQDAAKYLSYYLVYAPHDTEALEMQGLALDKAATTPQARWNACLVLEQVVRREPGRHTSRRHIVEIAMGVGRFSDAEPHLDRLLENPQFAADGELLYQRARCHEIKGEIDKAEKRYAEAVAQAPQFLPAYQAFAWMLRLNKRPEQADGVMDAMIRSNDRLEAYLMRAYYRKRFDTLERGVADVQKALEMAPEDAEVLLTAADFALAAGNLKQAGDYLDKAQKLHPQRWDVYRFLARLELQAQRHSGAVKHIRAGLKVLPNQAELHEELADLLIQSGEADALEEAERVLASLARRGHSSPWLGYLQACLMVYPQGRWSEATRLLEHIHPQLAGSSQQASRANTLLGRCYQQRGETDRQLEAYERAVRDNPASFAACDGKAAALLALGKVDEALNEYLVMLPALPGLGIKVAPLLISRTLQLPPGKRDWAAIEKILINAAEALPEAVEVPVLRAHLLAVQGQYEPAGQLLEELRRRHPDRVIVWIALAELFEAQGDAEKALHTLDEAERKLGRGVELSMARVNYWTRRAGAEASTALVKLEKDLGEFTTEEDRVRLLRKLAEAHSAGGNLKEAGRLWHKLVQLRPHDTRLQLLVFELALQANDEASVQRVLEKVQGVEGTTEGPLARYGRACQLIVRARHGNKQGLPKAHNLLLEVAQERPAWYVVPLREAEAYELEGNQRQAINSYLQALRLGERHPSAVRRVVQLLLLHQRFGEADKLLEDLYPRGAVPAALRPLVVDVALELGKRDQALALARKAVAEGSKDYRDYVWLGQILSAQGDQEEAEGILEQAVKMAGDSPHPWLAFIQCLVRTGQKDKAETAIQQAQAQLPPDQRPFTLALCYEIIGRPEQAEKHYQAALESKRGNVALLCDVAGFYLRSGQALKAEPFLRQALDPQSKATAGERAVVRRDLALLLVAKSPYEHFREALALVEQNLQTGGATADDQYAKAVVLTAVKSRRLRREALGILEEVLKRQPLAPDGLFLLARLHEAEGEWRQAKELFLSVVTAPNADPRYLAHYANSLLARDETNEALPYIQKLEKQEPQELRTLELRARALKAQGKGDAAVPLFQAYAQTKGANVRLAAMALERLGQVSAAADMCRKHAAESGQPEAVLVLAEHLARQGHLTEALDQWERALQTCPPAMVAAVGVNALWAAPKAPAKECQRVADWLQAAIKKNSAQETVLWGYLASVRNLQKDYKEAKDLYGKILERNKRSVVALNNLVYLLAMHDDDAAQALRRLNHALDTLGPVPMLLDTRATIYLKMGKPDLAIKELEDILSGAFMPGEYFHLAQAHLLTNPPNRSAAKDAWKKALTNGLKVNLLHPLEWKAYDDLALEFPF